VARKKHTPNDPERRQRILQSTITLLQEGGVAAISARTVAAEAEVPVGSVSYHFDSVRSLLLEAAHSVIELRDKALHEWSQRLTKETIAKNLAEMIHTQITTGRPLTIIAYELYLLGLRDADFRRLSVEATSVLSRKLAAHVSDAEAWRLAALADGVQMHSLFLPTTPSVDELVQALAN